MREDSKIGIVCQVYWKHLSFASKGFYSSKKNGETGVFPKTVSGAVDVLAIKAPVNAGEFTF